MSGPPPPSPSPSSVSQGKIGLAWHQQRRGKQLDSAMLRANAINMRADIATSVVVLIGLIGNTALGWHWLDAITAIGVALWLLRSAWHIHREAQQEFLDGVDDPELYQRILPPSPPSHKPTTRTASACAS